MAVAPSSTFRTPNGEVPGTFTNGLPNSNWMCRQIAFRRPMPVIAKRFDNNIFFNFLYSLYLSQGTNQLTNHPYFFVSDFSDIICKKYITLKVAFLAMLIFLVEKLVTPPLWILMIFYFRRNPGYQIPLEEKFISFKVGFCKYYFF